MARETPKNTAIEEVKAIKNELEHLFTHTNGVGDPLAFAVGVLLLRLLRIYERDITGVDWA